MDPAAADSGWASWKRLGRQACSSAGVPRQKHTDILHPYLSAAYVGCYFDSYFEALPAGLGVLVPPALTPRAEGAGGRGGSRVGDPPLYTTFSHVPSVWEAVPPPYANMLPHPIPSWLT